jgi:uncharacterized protein YdaU (DUF1376 family)
MTGTITMSLSEVGGYIRLLGHQWESGSVPGGDVSALARAMVCDRSEAEQVWPKISRKFREKKPGVWVNSRLEKERRKQAAFRKLQSNKGKRRAELAAAAEPGLSRNTSRKPTLQSTPSGSITPKPPKGGRRQTRAHLRAVAASHHDPAAVRQAEETKSRRAVLAEQGMTPEEIEIQLEREYEVRKARAS